MRLTLHLRVVLLLRRRRSCGCLLLFEVSLALDADCGVVVELALSAASDLEPLALCAYRRG